MAQQPPFVLNPAIVSHVGDLHIQDICVRLLLAAALGFAIGFERERLQKAAGLRTHVLVCAGSALFVLAPLSMTMTADGVSRVIQGIIQGIGFLGAGAILKLSDKAEIRGLTTSASVWMTSAVGVSAGIGQVWLPVVGAALACLVLGPLGRLEFHMMRPNGTREQNARRGTNNAAAEEEG